MVVRGHIKRFFHLPYRLQVSLDEQPESMVSELKVSQIIWRCYPAGSRLDIWSVPGRGWIHPSYPSLLEAVLLGAGFLSLVLGFEYRIGVPGWVAMVLFLAVFVVIVPSTARTEPGQIRPLWRDPCVRG